MLLVQFILVEWEEKKNLNNHRIIEKFLNIVDDVTYNENVKNLTSIKKITSGFFPVKLDKINIKFLFIH